MTDETHNTPAPLFSMAPAEIGGATVETVSARDLHAFMEVRRDFTNWIKDRISAYGFQEGVDYATDLLANFGEKGQGRPTKEFYLSIDMAKELSMVERNEKGREARLHFIECEKRLKALPDLNDPVALRGLLSNYSEKVIYLQRENATLAPKAAGFDLIANADGLICVRDAANMLDVRQKDLTALLVSRSWAYRRTDSNKLHAYAPFIRSGDLEHKVTTGTRPDGHEWASTQMMITPKGMTRLAELLAPRSNAA